MQVDNLPAIFNDAVPVIETIKAAGFEAYFVGGSVRDLLLNRPIHDIDIATSAYPEEIKRIFHHTIDTGIEHGTVTVQHLDDYYEVTTFRTESTYQDFRRPDSVTFVQDLHEDLKRRDFTINAFAMTENGQIIDQFDGLSDLKNRLIRAVGDPNERFHEDALRMMRAVRFVSQLDFELENQTRNAILNNNFLLEKIAVERIREEFVKMGLGQASKTGFREFLNTELEKYTPDLSNSKNLLKNYQTIIFLPTTEAVFWSLIIVLLKIANNKIKSFLKNWKNSNETIREVGGIVKLFDIITERTPTNFEIFESGQNTLLAAIDLANILGVDVNPIVLNDRFEHLAIKTRQDLAVDGRYLMEELNLKPGPEIGKLLNLILENVVNGQLKNNVENITNFVKSML